MEKRAIGAAGVEIYTYVKAHPNCGPTEVAQALNMKPGHVTAVIWRLRQNGLVHPPEMHKAPGKRTYRVTDKDLKTAIAACTVAGWPNMPKPIPQPKPKRRAPTTPASAPRQEATPEDGIELAEQHDDDESETSDPLAEYRRTAIGASSAVLKRYRK